MKKLITSSNTTEELIEKARYILLYGNELDLYDINFTKLFLSAPNNFSTDSFLVAHINRTFDKLIDNSSLEIYY